MRRWPRWPFLLLLLLTWVAFADLWIRPLFEPRGEFGGGYYRTRDLYLGVPVALLALSTTLASTIRPLQRRRFVARAMGVLFGMLAALIALDLAYSFDHLGLPQPFFWYGNVAIPRRGNLPDRELAWVRKPHLNEIRSDPTRMRRIVYRTDENGFRSDPSRRRADIVFLGDSYTEGPVVKEEETFVQRVGAASGLSVANLGRARYCPQQELLVLQKYGLSYRPRLVVWEIFEYKDLYSAEVFDAWTRSGGREPRPSRMERYTTASPIHSLLNRTVRPSKSCRLRLPSRGLRGAPQIVRFPYRADGPERYPLGFRLTKQSIARGLELCRAQGSEMLVLFMPTPVRFLEPHLVFEDPRHREKLLPGGKVSDPEDFGSQLARFCQGIDCPYIDLLPVLRAYAARDTRHMIFPSDEHLDVRGNEAVAEAVLQWLEGRRFGS